MARRARELGFTSTVGILHDGRGQLEPLGEREMAVYQALKRFGSRGDARFNARLPGQPRPGPAQRLELPGGRALPLRGRARPRPLLLADAGRARRAPRGLQAARDIAREYGTKKACAPYCTINCVQRVAPSTTGGPRRRDPPALLPRPVAAPPPRGGWPAGSATVADDGGGPPPARELRPSSPAPPAASAQRFARALRARGQRLVLVARRADRLRALAAELGGEEPWRCPVTLDLGRAGARSRRCTRSCAARGLGGGPPREQRRRRPHRPLPRAGPVPAPARR